MAAIILIPCYKVLSSYRDYKRIGSEIEKINKEMEKIIRSSSEFPVFGQVIGMYKTLSDFSINSINVFPSKIIVKMEKQEKPFRYSTELEISDSELLQKIIDFKARLTTLTKEQNNNNFSKALDKIVYLSAASLGLGLFGLLAETYFHSYTFTSIKILYISAASLGASAYLSAPGPKCHFNDNA